MSKRKHLEVQTIQKSLPAFISRTAARKILKCRASNTAAILDAYHVSLTIGTFNHPLKRWSYDRKQVEAAAVLRKAGKK